MQDKIYSITPYVVNSYIFSQTFEKKAYECFDQIGSKYGLVRQTLCEKIYRSQKNAYKAQNYGLEAGKHFWTRNPLKKLALLLKVSTRTIARALKDLKEFGLIKTTQFVENLVNYKTGRLMTDLYIAFNGKKLLELANENIPVVEKIQEVEPVDKSVDNFSYNDKMSTSYIKKNPYLKLDYILGFKHPMDNFKKFSTRLPTPTTKNILNFFKGKKETEMEDENWKENREKIVQIWNEHFNDQRKVYVSSNPSFNSLLQNAFNRVNKDFKKLDEYFATLKNKRPKDSHTSIFNALSPVTMDKVASNERKPRAGMYRLLNADCLNCFEACKVPEEKPLITETFDETLKTLENFDNGGDLINVLKRLGNSLKIK